MQAKYSISEPPQASPAQADPWYRTLRYTKKLALTFCFWVSVFSAEAQAVSLFKPLNVLRVIETDRFDIIFPRESEASARTLAVYADRVYEQVSGLLGIDVPGRIPVVITPYTDLFNGYTSLIPSPRILLFDTPMDLEWTSFADNLESLFLHELTHAVSLSSRGSFLGVLHRIFGGWVSPAMVNAPLFMVEGVTVSFESRSGFGRASDPLAKQKLRQALYEGKFLNPFQASGVYDLPGQEGAWYQYGGLFSAWLQKTYGEEKYAELWQALGQNFYFSFVVYRSGYYRIFKNVYGIDFIAAWNAFGASLALEDLEENPETIFPKQNWFVHRGGFSINALAAEGENVYILNSGEAKVRVYNTRTGSLRALNAGNAASADLDVSPHGALLLVSGYRFAGDRARAEAAEYRTDTGRKTGRTFQGIHKARYFRDGIIGIQPELHNASIVYEGFDGKREILVTGNEGLVFSGPQALDSERIVFTAARGGIRELWLYHYLSRELFRIETVPEDAAAWRYMRGLGVSEGKIFFSYNADDRMYKLARLDLDTMEAVWSRRDFSGGVFSPVSAGGSLYYRGSFFSGDGFLRFPETPAALSGKRSALRLVRLNRETPAAGTEMPLPELSPDRNVPDKTRPYFALRYMNPFKFWLPLPLIRMDENICLDGAGLLSIMADPAGRNFIILQAYADMAYRMAAAENITWHNTFLGFPLELSFSDRVINSGENVYRDTRGSISGVLTWGLGGSRYSQGVSLGALFALNAKDNGAASAYEWENSSRAFALFAGLALSGIRKQSHEIFGTGLEFSARGTSVLSGFEPRYEGLLRASAETRLPLSLTLYGSYDQKGMDLQGTSRTYGNPLFAAAASKEYPHPGTLALDWIGGGEAALGIFSFEVQNNLSHIYVNRFFGTLALRNVFYDGGGHPGAEGVRVMDSLLLAQSAVLKISMVFSIIPLKQAVILIEPNIWGAWKISNAITGRGGLWHIDAGINVRY
ncbi:MAG: hypothetical protein LBD31_08715 [Treponema sp.]|nr:hypothetical protein [Treponema sp.]